MAVHKANDGGKDITLRDVITHVTQRFTKLEGDMQTMEQRLRTDMQKMEHRLNVKIDTSTANLTDRMDALEEDLVATIKDTVRIRRHVGMRLPSDV